MAKVLTVDVVSPTGVLWAGEASSVVVPALDGDLGVLPGREPILAVLREGKARVISDGRTTTIDVVGGFVSVDSDVVTVVVPDELAAADIIHAVQGTDTAPTTD